MDFRCGPRSNRCSKSTRFPARAEAALVGVSSHDEGTGRGASKRAPSSDTLRAVLERTGYRKMLEDEGTEESRARLANLDELLNAAADAVRARRSAFAIFWITPRWSPTPIRPTSAPRSRC